MSFRRDDSWSAQRHLQQFDSREFSGLLKTILDGDRFYVGGDGGLALRQ